MPTSEEFGPNSQRFQQQKNRRVDLLVFSRLICGGPETMQIYVRRPGPGMQPIKSCLAEGQTWYSRYLLQQRECHQEQSRVASDPFSLSKVAWCNLMAFAFHRRWFFCRPTGIQNFHKFIPPCKKKKPYIPKMLTPDPTGINWAHKTGSSRKMYQLLFLQGWLHSAQFSCSDPWGYVYVCMRVCVHACMYVCMYVYTLYMILSMFGQSSLALLPSLKKRKLWGIYGLFPFGRPWYHGDHRLGKTKGGRLVSDGIRL